MALQIGAAKLNLQLHAHMVPGCNASQALREGEHVQPGYTSKAKSFCGQVSQQSNSFSNPAIKNAICRTKSAMREMENAISKPSPERKTLSPPRRHGACTMRNCNSAEFPPCPGKTSFRLNDFNYAAKGW